MSDKGEKPKIDRKTNELLRQFLKFDGPKGAPVGYGARYDYAFKLNDVERTRVDNRVDRGFDFEHAVREVQAISEAAKTFTDEDTDPGDVPTPIQLVFFGKKDK